MQLPWARQHLKSEVKTDCTQLLERMGHKTPNLKTLGSVRYLLKKGGISGELRYMYFSKTRKQIV